MSKEKSHAITYPTKGSHPSFSIHNAAERYIFWHAKESLPLKTVFEVCKLPSRILEDGVAHEMFWRTDDAMQDKPFGAVNRYIDSQGYWIVSRWSTDSN